MTQRDLKITLFLAIILLGTVFTVWMAATSDARYERQLQEVCDCQKHVLD